MKKSKVVIPALGLIALSTAASITGTVAWFSANQRVEIRGMTVKTKVSSNLMVVEDVASSTVKKDENLFSTGPINTSIAAILEPVSTVNGSNFYYTVNAKADGDALTDSYTLYNSATAASDTDAYTNAFSETYQVSKAIANEMITGENQAKPFADYVVQVKAVNAEGEAKNLRISKLELKYGGATDNNLAYRVAFDVQTITSVAPVASFTTAASRIFAPSTAKNFNQTNRAVTLAANVNLDTANPKYYTDSACTVEATGMSTAGVYYLKAETDPKAVASTSALDALACTKYNNTNCGILASVAANDTAYFKITARLYLEGEDTTCNNETFAALTNSWSLSIDYELGGTAPVTVTALTMAHN